MKKLIKYYDSNDVKLTSFRLVNYGTFNNMLKNVVAGSGFNPVAINKIEIISPGNVKFSFTTPGNYNHLLDEIVNIQGIPDEEFVIKEITTTFIRCEYYDNTYSISTNLNFSGNIVNSSLGFNLIEDNGSGKLTIAPEADNSRYVFYDVASTNFTNAQPYRVVGTYVFAKDNPSIKAPFDKTTNNYNDLLEWQTTSVVVNRRSLANMVYENGQRFFIIGNGNFCYIITGKDSYAWYHYAFGTYKSYLNNFNFNSLLLSKPQYQDGSVNRHSYSSSANETAGDLANGQHCRYSPQALVQSSTGNQYNGPFSSTYVNLLSTPSNASSVYGSNAIVDNGVNTQLLYGFNSPGAFTLAPNIYHGGDNAGSPASFPYPNPNNQMILSSVNIIGGNNTTTRQDTLMGKMPFLYWYCHPITTSPGNLQRFTINDNGNTRKFFVLKQGTSYINVYEITPTGFDNY